MYKDVIMTVDNPRLEIANAHDMYKHIIYVMYRRFLMEERQMIRI